MMWQTWFIWKFINNPLPDTNPFHKLPIFKSPRPIKKRPPFSHSLIAFLIALIGGLSCMGCVFFIWILLLFGADRSLSLLVMLLPFILFYATVAGNLTAKIINRLGKIQSVGLSDLIGVTPFGEPLGTWQIACITYQQMSWIKITVIIIHAGMKMIALFWILMILGTGLDVILQNIPSESFVRLVTEIIELAVLVSLFYLSFIHAVVMGYLIAIWGNHLPTDGMSRISIAIGGVLGSQLGLYLIAYIALFVGLPTIFVTMGWGTSIILTIIQLIGMMLFIEIQVWGILHLLAHQAESPYMDWKSEFGVWQK